MNKKILNKIKYSWYKIYMDNVRKLDKTIIFTIIIGNALIFAFTGCDFDTCTHTWSEWETISTANCTTAGQQKQTCTECKWSKTRDNPNDPALGHRPNLETGICTVCYGLTYKIGDTGPGGGKICFVADGQKDRPFGFTVHMVNPDDNYIAYYLEITPANLLGGTGKQNTMRWSTAEDSPYAAITGLTDISDIDIGYNKQTETQIAFLKADIGNGRKNTAIIVQHEDNDSTYIYAARAAYNYSNNGKSDWFLPCIGELYWLNQNKNVIGLPTTGSGLWSSSQYDSDKAWYISLYNGHRLWDPKRNHNIVRAVRAF